MKRDTILCVIHIQHPVTKIELIVCDVVEIRRARWRVQNDTKTARFEGVCRLSHELSLAGVAGPHSLCKALLVLHDVRKPGSSQHLISVPSERSGERHGLHVWATSRHATIESANVFMTHVSGVHSSE